MTHPPQHHQQQQQQASQRNAWESDRLVAQDGWMTDPQNRVVILHGINVSGGTKMPFYRPPPSSSSSTSSFAASSTLSSASIAIARATGTDKIANNNSTHANSSMDTKQELDLEDLYKGEVPGVIHTYHDKHFYEHRDISFVNRPFPLKEADQHFERLARWGCQCVRMLVPWEALEHGGPGIYDEEYIDYLLQLLRIASKYGLKCFLDPHVDCWSRFTGGSGMPGWTIELVGMDMTKFGPTEAAIVQNTYKNKEEYPHMIWATNSIKVAAATMYTLFFAGQVFAPQATVPLSTTVLSYLRKMHTTIVADEAYRRGVPGGQKSPSPVQHVVPIPLADLAFVQAGEVNIQHFLQGHFFEAFAHLAKRVHEDDQTTGLISRGTVMGFDSINEPSPGYLNHPDMNSLLELADLQIGVCPTPFQGLAIAQGRSVECQKWETGGIGPLKKGKVKVNTEHVNLWKRPVWKRQEEGQMTSVQKPSGGRRGDLHQPSAPPMTPHRGGAEEDDYYYQVGSPYEVVSRLGISAAQSAISAIHHATSATTSTPLSATALAEAQLSRTNWPTPTSYSDVCLWAQHGLWDPATDTLLQPHYFEKIPQNCKIEGLTPGQQVEWKQDFWLPFVNTFSLRLRQQDPRFSIFVEPPINEAPPMFRLKKVLIGGASDGLLNMVRSLTKWRPSFKSLHSRQDSLQGVEDTLGHGGDTGVNRTVTSGSSDEQDKQIDGTKKGKGSSQHGHPHDLHENACQHPTFDPLGDISENVVVAPHFYDGYTNVTRDFVPFTLDYLGYKRGLYWSVLGALKFGWGGVRTSWQDQVRGIQSDVRYAIGHQQAVLMGETGIPMDMHTKASYKGRYGNPKQDFALSLLLEAMDASMLSFTLWNYCGDNSNQWGDRWNGEDFSVWMEPENGFLKPEFVSCTEAMALTGPNSASSVVSSLHLDHAVTTAARNPKMTLTEISNEMGTGKEVAGCNEGCLWWCCLPGSHVWTKRTAPRRLIVLSVDPDPTTSAAQTASSSNHVAPSSTVGSISGSSSISAAASQLPLDSWQDLLPLSIQLERGRMGLYGGLRVAESFIRAYPLAIWGVPLHYRFEPGQPIDHDHPLLGQQPKVGKTNHVRSWQNRFQMLYKLECQRSSSNNNSTCHDNPHPQASEISSISPTTNNMPSTDIFLPRFHFPLDTLPAVDHFESLQLLHEIRHQQTHGSSSSQFSAGSASSSLSSSSKDLGKWYRLDIQITDGSFYLSPPQQILQYWATTPPTINPDDNLASTREMMDAIEERLERLFMDQAWDGQEGITTLVEQEWIAKLWKEMKRGQAAAEAFVAPGFFSWIWPTVQDAAAMKVEKEEKYRLKLEELRQAWRERIGLPGKGAVVCLKCGQLEVMHLHGVMASVQMWSGYRG